MLSAKEVVYEVTRALDAKKGLNIKLLKIDKVSSLADYFLICTGTSSTHVKTLCDYAEYTLEQLSSEQAVPLPKYRTILNDFRRKYDNLNQIKSTNSKFVKEFNDAKYYWIPIENLP